MSTRGRIGVLRPDGRVESIYNHFDSYIEGGLGDALKQFKDAALVDELIKLGDRASLFADRDWRDKEKIYGGKGRFDKSIDAYLDNDDDWDIEYKYLYDPTKNEWQVSSYGEPWAALVKPSKIHQQKVGIAPNLRRRFKSPLDQANALLDGGK